MGRDACIDEPVFFAIRSPTQEVNVNTRQQWRPLQRRRVSFRPILCPAGLGCFCCSSAFSLYKRIAPRHTSITTGGTASCARRWRRRLRRSCARRRQRGRQEEGPSLIEFLQTLKTLFLQEFARPGKDIRPCAAFLWNDDAHGIEPEPSASPPKTDAGGEWRQRCLPSLGPFPARR